MPKNNAAEAGDRPRVKISQSEFPATNLQAAVRVAEALWDQFAGKSAAPHDVAMALNVSPTSSAWRLLTGSAVAYGLTQGAYNAGNIALTELGKRIVAPTEEGDDLQAKVEAMLKPRVLREFFQKYDRAKFPRDDIAKNVLAGMGLPKDRLDRAFEIAVDNGKYVGVIRDTKTGHFVALGSPAFAVPESTRDHGTAEDSVGDDEGGFLIQDSGASPTQQPAPEPPAQPSDKQIFVAHGKNHKPLEDLKRILDQFKIPYKVAVDEPHVGRPISRKVAQLMRECSAGIFIFTGDESFEDATGNAIHRPSENVVYELGAATVLWENKIIILKQKDVTFPSDYKDLGYIEFDENGLAPHALDLLRELIGLEFVRVQAA